MKFTEETPTKPGAFYWKGSDSGNPLVLVLEQCRQLMVISPSSYSGYYPSMLGGLWSAPLEPVKPKCSVDGFRTGCGHWFEYMAKDSLLYCPFCGGERA